MDRFNGIPLKNALDIQMLWHQKRKLRNLKRDWKNLDILKKLFINIYEYNNKQTLILR